MRLSDIAGLVASHGAERFMRKRAGIVLPLAVGAMLPGIARRAVERASSTEQAMDRASGAKIAGDMSWMGRPNDALRGQVNFSRFNPTTQPGPSPPGMMSQIFGNMGSGASHTLGEGAKSVAGAPLQGVASGISGGIGESIKRMLLGREFGERKDPMHLGGSAAISAFGKEMGTTGANLLRDIANKAMETASHAGDESARQAILGDLKRTDPVLASADDKVLMEAYHTMARFAPVLSTDKNAVRSFLRQAVMSGSGPDYMSIKLIADSERSVTDTGKDKR